MKQEKSKDPLSGVIKMYNTLEFHHEDYQDRCFRMRCHTDHTFHNKFPVVRLAPTSLIGLCVLGSCFGDTEYISDCDFAELLQVCSACYDIRDFQ